MKFAGSFPPRTVESRFVCLRLAYRRLRLKLVFFATRIEHLADERRQFALSPEEAALINPNTRTCPVFRSQADAELAKKIYRRVPVLIDENQGKFGNPWGISFMTMFHMANDSGLFRTHAQLRAADGQLDRMIWTLPGGERWLPLWEGRMIRQFDHRRAEFDEEGSRIDEIDQSEKASASSHVRPRYWVSQNQLKRRMGDIAWPNEWFLGWRDITNSTSERSVLASFLPLVPVGHTLPLIFVNQNVVHRVPCLTANLNSLAMDYVARLKMTGNHLIYMFLKQFPILPPADYEDRDLGFIVPRVLELTYTAWDMQPFARDLGYEGEPFRWDPERRALLRAELDAYYVYLYGLSKKELRYILDPKEVMGEDYPSETFRVLKDNETKKYGEYRTQRLVLEAYDRFANDGTFDPARLEDPEYFPVVRQALKTKGEQLTEAEKQLRELEGTLAELMARSDRTPLPTLFVEGETDKLIVERAWRALFPDKPSPVSALSAGGTMQMKSLAAPGTAMQQLLGDRLVLALADNDGPGRELAPHKELHGGGEWIKQTNGTHWCLLAPTDEFRRVMERFEIPATFWPFTIENAFSAALRRQAAADGAYAFSGDLQAELLRDPGVAKRAFQAFKEIAAADDAYFHLMAPTYEAKDAFAAWVADPARLTPENFAAFRLVLNGLKDLLARHDGHSGIRQAASGE